MLRIRLQFFLSILKRVIQKLFRIEEFQFQCLKQVLIEELFGGGGDNMWKYEKRKIYHDDRHWTHFDQNIWLGWAKSNTDCRCLPTHVTTADWRYIFHSLPLDNKHVQTYYKIVFYLECNSKFNDKFVYSVQNGQKLLPYHF